ncbi:MAG: carbohydrate ABC transporter permease, partial [Clostridiales bacterium]|nr:carbohydrate ABC transporter permease [Clostridiales bacterium]
TWNDFMGPLIYLTDTKKFTLTIGMSFFRGMYDSRWNYVMAAAVVSVTPILTLYMFTQRYFEEGIVMTGIKG